MQRIANFINNEFVPAASGKTLDVVEPATGAVYATAPASDASDIVRAAAAAANAFPKWSHTSAGERSRLMLRLADLIDANLDELARTESIDSGKPVSLARTVDIPRAAANFRFFAQAIINSGATSFDMPPGSVPGDPGASAINYELRRPRGVAGLISPWNLPLYLLTWKIAPAIAAGNTCVCKPSEVTPMTAFLLSKLVVEAGFAPGVINIVHGTGAECGSALITHPNVPTISFTGSTAVGKWIAEAAGGLFKRISLELGGKNPYIVFADADFESAVNTGVRAAFANQGQICLCGSRMLVEQSIFDRYVGALVERAKSLRISDPSEAQTEQGSLVSEAHLEKVARYVDMARQLGGKIHCGGVRVNAEKLPQRCAKGAFFAPTVITGLANECAVIQEEIFGPVVTVQPFANETEAVRLANSTPYGLAASIWTGDVSRAHRVAAEVESGIIWVNCWMLRDLRTPFGGMKQSGVGREGGTDALKFFTEAKNVCVRVGGG